MSDIPDWLERWQQTAEDDLPEVSPDHTGPQAQPQPACDDPALLAWVRTTWGSQADKDAAP